MEARTWNRLEIRGETFQSRKTKREDEVTRVLFAYYAWEYNTKLHTYYSKRRFIKMLTRAQAEDFAGEYKIPLSKINSWLRRDPRGMTRFMRAYRSV